jgi:hypothetical protein
VFRLVCYIPQLGRLEDTFFKGFVSRISLCISSWSIHCCGNVFSFLGNMLILSLAYWLLREQRLLSRCPAMDVSVTFRLQYSGFLGSLPSVAQQWYIPACCPRHVF